MDQKHRFSPKKFWFYDAFDIIKDLFLKIMIWHQIWMKLCPYFLILWEIIVN